MPPGFNIPLLAHCHRRRPTSILYRAEHCTDLHHLFAYRLEEFGVEALPYALYALLHICEQSTSYASRLSKPRPANEHAISSKES